MHVVDFDCLRLGLECPLVGTKEYFAERVRNDEMICATTEVYFVGIDDPGVDHVRAAMAIGNVFLLKVCREALERRGLLREYVEVVFADALTEVFVLERIQVLNPDTDKPVLRGMFAQAIFSTLSRGMDILFVSATQGELPFWHDTISARPVGDFIVRGVDKCRSLAELEPLTCPIEHTAHGSPSRSAGDWRDLMDLNRPTSWRTDA